VRVRVCVCVHVTSLVRFQVETVIIPTLLVAMSGLTLDPIQFPSQWGKDSLSMRVTRPDHEDDHSAQFNAKLKMRGALPLPLNAF
jgi:hypothetical protein